MQNFLILELSMVLRLVVAVILGGIIGLERGANHDAGLRTHIIVCIGSASVMVLSECLVKQYEINSEIMRIGAQVISGIGFLGAGSIIIDGNRVRGITTAAGLWATACAGLVVGSGYFLLAICIVALMLFAMYGLRPITRKQQNKSLVHNIRIDLISRSALYKVMQKLIDEEIDIKAIRINENEKSKIITSELEIKLPQSYMMSQLIQSIGTYEGVIGIL